MRNHGFVVDAHCDIALAMLDEQVDIGHRLRSTHFDLSRARQGGVGAQFFALFVDPDEFSGSAAWRRTLALLESVEKAAAQNPSRLGLARTASQIYAHNAARRIAGLLGLEGAHGFGTASPELVLARLRLLARRGLRYLGLTWNNSNALAGAAVDGGGGLTALGRRVVRECERLGVLVDLSHASDATARDVLQLSRRPVLASHSNARALCDVPRNLPDPILKRIGRQGGVVCVNFFPGFLDARAAKDLETRYRATRPAAEALRRRFEGERRGLARAERRLVLAAVRAVARVPLARVVEHIEHHVNIAGEHAVGLGADFDGMLLTPVGLEDAAAYPRLARVLARRFPARTVRAILGENLLRILKE